jgi:hypothetical protein
MKNRLLNTTFIATSLLLTASYTNIASAHNASGSLGQAASATDLYMVSCFDNGDGTGVSARLAMQVADLAPAAAPKVSVQVIKGVSAVTSTDSKDGDAKYSPFVYSNGGDGSYYVSVSKTAAGAENYDLDFHCQNAAGGHTGTTIQMLQNK